ncbi:MAG: SDR family NAD(P)-dependent oxidoreductase [Saprospiraceae bacterium]|nr:SDR family NAD(P)-dependent oxidoreductase [Saprospiraceae bacterium]
MHPLLSKSTIFADGLDHPECVAVHPDGTVWAGGEAGQVYRISADGKTVEEVANTGGFILGLAFSPGANWLAICDLGKKRVWRLDLPSLKLSLFADGAGGHRFNIPNYAVFDKMGNLYVSESGAFRQVTGKVLKFSPSGNGEIWHDGGFNFSNGMAMGPAEKYLYLAVSFLPGVERVEILTDGSAGKRSLVCTLPESVPDGLAFDADGNLYVSCYCPEQDFQSNAQRRNHGFLWATGRRTPCPTRPTLPSAARNLDQLFAANLGRWHITKIDAGVRGLPLASHNNEVEIGKLKIRFLRPQFPNSTNSTNSLIHQPMSFTNKTAVITGGAKGIGGACSRIFYRENANVVILDTDPLGQELADKLGERALFIQCDVSKETQVKQAMEKAAATFGGIAVLSQQCGHPALLQSHGNQRRGVGLGDECQPEKRLSLCQTRHPVHVKTGQRRGHQCVECAGLHFAAKRGALHHF